MIGGKNEMRNPSKNTIKKLFQEVNNQTIGWGFRYSNYFLFNEVGARLFVMSKGKICNRHPKGYKKYRKSNQKTTKMKTLTLQNNTTKEIYTSSADDITQIIDSASIHFFGKSGNEINIIKNLIIVGNIHGRFYDPIGTMTII